MAGARASVPLLAAFALAALLALAPAGSGFVALQTSHPGWVDAEAAFQPYTGVYDPGSVNVCLLLLGSLGTFVDPMPYYGTLRLAVYEGVEARNQEPVDQPLPPPLDDCAGLANAGQHLVAGDVDSHAGGVVWQTTLEDEAWCLYNMGCTATYRVYEWSSCTYTQGASGAAAGLPLATASKVSCTNELCDPLVLTDRPEVHYGLYVWLHNGSSHEADDVPHVGLPDDGPHEHGYLDAFHLCEPEEEVGGAWVDRNAIVQVCLEGGFYSGITGATAAGSDQDHFALLNSEADPLDTAAFLQATVLDPSTWSNLEPDTGC